MGELARYSLMGTDKLYKEFGINAELLIDHAWGWEPVTMSDIKAYKSDNHSISSGQVLKEPYDYQKAKTIVMEMADEMGLDLMQNGLVTDQIVLTVGYDVSNAKTYKGELTKDWYGRQVPKHARGTANLDEFSNNSRLIIQKCEELFNKIIDKNLTVRRIYVVANHVHYGEYKKPLKQLDIFTDYEKEASEQERDARRQEAILKIKRRYGKNAILKGINYEEGATMRDRHRQVGGHKA